MVADRPPPGRALVAREYRGPQPAHAVNAYPYRRSPGSRSSATHAAHTAVSAPDRLAALTGRAGGRYGELRAAQARDVGGGDPLDDRVARRAGAEQVDEGRDAARLALDLDPDAADVRPRGVGPDEPAETELGGQSRDEGAVGAGGEPALDVQAASPCTGVRGRAARQRAHPVNPGGLGSVGGHAAMEAPGARAGPDLHRTGEVCANRPAAWPCEGRNAVAWGRPQACTLSPRCPFSSDGRASPW